ncbi:hypothetical protein AAFF39_05700 [Lactococcus garvieae]
MEEKTALEAMRLMVKIPFVGRFVQLYLTAYFSREWGNLIAQAVDLRQICFIMQEQKVESSKNLVLSSFIY